METAMKKMIILTTVMICLFLSMSLAFGATLNLKGTWDRNAETDLAGYNLYRADGIRTKVNTSLIGITFGTATIPYLFSITIADGAEGTLRFKLTAVDTAGNESLDSNEAPYTYDLKAPAAPTGFGIFK
jgi:hypothetical protein